MGKIQESRVEDEIPSFDGFNEPLIELGLMLFQELGGFNISTWDAIQDTEDMFALEQEIL